MAILWSDLAYLSFKAMLWINSASSAQKSIAESPLLSTFSDALNSLESAIQCVADTLREMDSVQWKGLEEKIDRSGLKVRWR
jgi:hypothetical protein